MAQGKLKKDLALRKARQDRVIKRRIEEAPPARPKAGLARIEDRTKPKT